MQGKITGMTTTMTLYTVLYILYRLYPRRLLTGQLLRVFLMK